MSKDKNETTSKQVPKKEDIYHHVNQITSNPLVAAFAAVLWEDAQNKPQ